ncbi:MAG: hypothetical protein P1V97_20200 [Planctomycetota bacterium]|nr:hypothetical protein [Planctomycetota bacterium]
MGIVVGRGKKSKRKKAKKNAAKIGQAQEAAVKSEKSVLSSEKRASETAFDSIESTNVEDESRDLVWTSKDHEEDAKLEAFDKSILASITPHFPTLVGFAALTTALFLSAAACVPGRLLVTKFEEEWGWIVAFAGLLGISVVSGMGGIRLIFKNADSSLLSIAWRVIVSIGITVGVTIVVAQKFSTTNAQAVPVGFIVIALCRFGAARRANAIAERAAKQ